MKVATLRARLSLSRAELARGLGVHERTVMRWEEGDHDPSGLAAEVFRGIASALDEGADPNRVGQLVGMGIGALLYSGLTQRKR